MKNIYLSFSLIAISALCSCAKEAQTENSTSDTEATARKPKARQSQPVLYSQGEMYPIWRLPVDALRAVWTGVGWVIYSMSTQQDEPVSERSALEFNACMDRATRYCTQQANAGRDFDECWAPRAQACLDALERANGY